MYSIPDALNRILKSTADLQSADIPSLYDGFNSPVAELDCGKKCAPHNPGGKPFCCDICQAVPAAYKVQGLTKKLRAVKYLLISSNDNTVNCFYGRDQ